MKVPNSLRGSSTAVVSWRRSQPCIVPHTVSPTMTADATMLVSRGIRYCGWLYISRICSDWGRPSIVVPCSSAA
ncbi:hypothetical protein D3C87_1816320 [compost metagenome]